MSSTYRAICIAHKPAIVPSDGHQSVVAALADVRAGDHPDCALLVGRWSGGLVEIGCPPPGHSHGYHPHGIEWADAAWLRIAALALDIDTPQMTKALNRAPRCFYPERLKLLRPLLIPSEELR